ncbi:THAP domain family protein [Brugia pahangi]
MPTTCGFPNCKFRSRYRGQEDNRHFYRIPKRPQVLRQRWLLAIGRTEDTVVSQTIPYRIQHVISWFPY